VAGRSKLAVRPTSSELVLCVDDEASALQARKSVLERQGYSVVTATNAAQALEFFKAARFDLVITDHLLGRGTATAMTAEMKRLNPCIPIIVLSGIAEPPEQIENVDAFISKIDGLSVLFGKINELLQRHEEMQLGIVTKGASKVVGGDSEFVQRLLAAIVESSDDAILSKTLDGIITSWNKGAEEMYGYSAEEIIGRPISTLLPPDRPDEVNKILERLKRGEKIDHFETRRSAKGGHLLTVSLTISPIYDSHGHIVGASTIARW
jgi:PAS domain S-box-containing protein